MPNEHTTPDELSTMVLYKFATPELSTPVPHLSILLNVSRMEDLSLTGKSQFTL